MESCGNILNTNPFICVSLEIAAWSNDTIDNDFRIKFSLANI